MLSSFLFAQRSWQTLWLQTRALRTGVPQRNERDGNVMADGTED